MAMNRGDGKDEIGRRSDVSGVKQVISSFPSQRILEFTTDDSRSVQLDIDNQCLWVRDQAIQLTPKAFQVLHYLSLHQRQVVSHKDLGKHLWPDTFVETNNLKKYIREARRMLGDDPKQPNFIETLARRGYRFLASVRSVGSTAARTTQSTIQVPIVGRDPHMVALQESFAKAEEGGRQIVFVHGEPGIGKTALVDAFLRSISTDGPVRHGIVRCMDVAGNIETYSPLFELFEELCDADVGGSTTLTLGEHAPTVIAHLYARIFREHRHLLEQKVQQTVSPRMMAREMIRAIEMLARTEPMLLILEDVQWADRGTIDLLSTLARRDLPVKLMVIVTCRSPLPNTAAVPIKKMMHDLACRSLCLSIAVERITRDDIATYLTQLPSNGKPSASFINTLYNHSDGNPYIMQAMLEKLIAPGVCPCHKAEWPTNDVLSVTHIPVKVRDFIGLQLDTLPTTERKLLEAASVVGDSFTAAELAATLASDLESVETLMMTHLRTGHFITPMESVEQEAAEACKFSIPVFRTVIYECIPPLRKQQMHRRLAEWLESQYGGRDASIDRLLAVHFQEAHDWTRAIPYLLLSSEPESRMGAIDRTLKLLRKSRNQSAERPAESPLKG